MLLLGDSQIYCSFLDNPDTIGADLQRMFPDREIVGAANLGYGLDDLESLFRERARFIEPDLVIVQTGGGDVLDAFFSHRNLFSRRRAAVEPTAVDERFYRGLAAPTARQEGLRGGRCLVPGQLFQFDAGGSSRSRPSWRR